MLYQVTVRQRYFDQQVINRFHYNSSGTPAAVQGSFGLLFAMGFLPGASFFAPDTVAGQMQALQNVNLEYLEAECAAMYDPVDFYTNPYSPPIQGVVAGEAGSPVLAIGFNTSRVRLDIRRGQKRIGGIGESFVGEGGELTATAILQAEALQSAMGDTLLYDDEGNTLTYNPVILSYEQYTTPGGNEAYRPYSTLAAQLTHMAVGFSWNYKAQVRTQNSRQYGHGS